MLYRTPYSCHLTTSVLFSVQITEPDKIRQHNCSKLVSGDMMQSVSTSIDFYQYSYLTEDKIQLVHLFTDMMNSDRST